MGLYFMDFEIPLLQALAQLGGIAKPIAVYPEVERIMGLDPAKFPEEYGTYKGGQIKWKNKTAWAREYLKRKRQIDGAEKGVWKITELGRERIRVFHQSKKDPDEGLAQLHGVDASIADETSVSPKEGFRKIEEIQIHETGGILGVKGIVYEPINEQGVILLFAALCHDLEFMIEGVRSSFPDALLRKRNTKGTWNSCKAEFEFRASNFKFHKHSPEKCDLIICWENDWSDSPVEVLCLKEVVGKYR